MRRKKAKQNRLTLSKYTSALLICNRNTWVFVDMCQDCPRNRTRVYVQYGRLSSQTFEESSENPFHRVVRIWIWTQIWCGLMQPRLDKRIWNGGRGRKKKVQRRMPSPPALPSLLREQNISFFPPSLSSYALLSTLSCLGGWCRRGEPECERGPQRADEDRVHVCVHMYGCVRRQCIGRNPGACLPVLSVCLVLVSTPHSLIKGWAKPLTGRLNLKG